MFQSDMGIVAQAIGWLDGSPWQLPAMIGVALLATVIGAIIFTVLALCIVAVYSIVVKIFTSVMYWILTHIA